MTSIQSTPLLQMTDIGKSFPGVLALDGVSIHLHCGEVLGIIGENGAGKSTLIKTLGGAHRADTGQILLDGTPIDLTTPARAQAAGIGIIYQEFNLVPFLTVRENIFLGRARHRAGIVNVREERRATGRLFQRLGMNLDPEAPVAHLSIAEKQLVEIAKALHSKIRVLVMDEPTATLTPSEVSKLFEIIDDLRRQGIGIIYISHRLDEVLEYADRVVVLRDGKKVTDKPIVETDRREMIELMVGRSIENEFPKHELERRSSSRQPRLEVDGLGWADRVVDVSFSVHAGEVLGVTGLVGAGRSEVARLIAGAEQPDVGTIKVDGQAARFSSPRDAIDRGICFLTEDRQGQGLVLAHAARENFGLPNLDRFSRRCILNLRNETSALLRFVDSLKIKMASPQQPVAHLSGGNQQKLVLAKWLERDCEIVIIDEPTRGIDVGAKYEIYLLINELAARGKAIILISSELPEVLGMADRILVMRGGRIAGEITKPATATQQQIMELAAH